MTSKLLMGKIDYINASPVYYGLDNGLLPDWLEMIEGPPAVLNRMILEGTLPISPVSSAFYGMNHKDLLVLPDLSISSVGRVLSVILMSNCSLDALDAKKLILTEDSATSVALLRLFMAENNVTPDCVTRRVRTLEDIPEDADAALIIGDAALSEPWESRFRQRFDLGDLWYRMTGLPFVFAVWVVSRSFARENARAVRDIVTLLHQSRSQGNDHLETVISSGARKLGLPLPLIREYYDLLFCDLDQPKIAGLETFFADLHDRGLFSEKVRVHLFQ